MGAIAGGVGAGLLGGLVSNQKEGGTSTGNLFANPNVDNNVLEQQAGNATAMAQNVNNQNVQQQVQGNSMLNGLYGDGSANQNGILQQTEAQEQQQASQPWALTPEDQSAYGQASGNIANMFGQSNNSLSQSLANRGLSSSGVAGAAFTGAQGNQNEQLAGLQTQIANNRQQLNMQRLGQTQNFLSQLGQGANQALNTQNNMNQTQANTDLNIGQSAQNYLSNEQGQANTGLQQQQQTAHASTLSNALSGGMGGATAGAGLASSMSGGGSAAPTMGSSAGGPLTSASMFA